MTINKLSKKILNVNKASIKNIEINKKQNAIIFEVEMHKSSKHRCPICGKKCSGYDTISVKRSWRAMDLGSYKTFIVSKVDRICCKAHGVVSEFVPWARHNSRFTHDFEDHLAYCSLHLNKKETSRLMRVAWNTVGEVLTRVRKDLERNLEDRFNGLEIIGIDETSYQKGHKYITTIVDQVRKRVVYIYEGKTRDGLDDFFKKLTESQRNSIKYVSGDGAKRISASVKDHLPNAEFCIDAFHVVQRAIEAMDEARKEIWRDLKDFKKERVEKYSRNKSRKTKRKLLEHETIKKTAKYALGKNPENLTINQQNFIDKQLKTYPKLYRCYLLKEELRLLLKMDDPVYVGSALKKRYFKASHSRLESIKKLGDKINKRYDQIINTVKYKISNALIESFNNTIKGLIKKSYGFRNLENMKDLIYISCSDLSKRIVPAFEKMKIT